MREVDLIRQEHPGCGVEKMYYTLLPKSLGRDKFCEIFIELGYRIKNTKNYKRTTVAGKLYYPNFIEGMSVHRPLQVLQSDITYYDLGGRFYYIIFIIDVYTKLILAHQVSDNMRAHENVKMIKKMLDKNQFVSNQTIHHSDRGSQYSSKEYTRLLKKSGIKISMGLVATDNAYAERVNGIIKNEYLKRKKIKSFKELKVETKKAVSHYNRKRKHRAFKMKFTPLEFRNSLVNLETQKRPKVIIYAEGNSKFKQTSSLLEFNPKEDPQANNCPIEII